MLPKKQSNCECSEKSDESQTKSTHKPYANQPTNHMRHLLGAFAASHLQISTMYQEQIITLARMSLLLEVKAVAEYD
jgi:hypothetical protein